MPLTGGVRGRRRRCRPDGLRRRALELGSIVLSRSPFTHSTPAGSSPRLTPAVMDDDVVLSPARRVGSWAGDRGESRPPARRGRDAALLRRQPLRAYAREHAWPAHLPGAIDHVPCQRQLHGATLLDRRAQACQRRVGDRGHPLLQLRQGRQEGAAPRVDPRAGVRRRHRAAGRRPRRDHGPARAPGAGLLPRPGRRSLCPADSGGRDRGEAHRATSSSSSPDAGFAKQARRSPTGCTSVRHRGQALRRPHRDGRGDRAHRRGRWADER